MYRQRFSSRVIRSTLLGILALAAAPSAMATLYQGNYSLLNNAANYSPMHNNGFSIASWNANLTVNAQGPSILSGTAVGTNHVTYLISMVFSDTYTANGNRYWGDFTGTLTPIGSNQPSIVFADINGSARNTSYDAVIGINATPYNNGRPGGNAQALEFGFWGAEPPGGFQSRRNSDVNVQVRCTSGLGSGGAANANGTCTEGPNGVPLPGTLALLGLGLVGAAVTRRTRRV